MQRGVAINNRVTQPLHQRIVTVTPGADGCASVVCGATANVLLFLVIVCATALGAVAIMTRGCTEPLRRAARRPPLSDSPRHCSVPALQGEEQSELRSALHAGGSGGSEGSDRSDPSPPTP